MSSHLRCPGCSTELARTQNTPPVQWICADCDLAWVTRVAIVSTFGPEIVDRLVERLQDSMPSENSMVCPHCGTMTLKTITISDVQIELCETCRGVLLQGRESLTRIHREQLGQSPPSGGPGTGELAAGLLQVIGEILIGSL